MSLLQEAFQIIGERAKNTKEMGIEFERLAKMFLENDSTQIYEYSQVWHYGDWAADRHGYLVKDTGIDLVAKLRNAEGYCAIQCKFYQPAIRINKKGLDLFISASTTIDFTRLLLIDTSIQPVSMNAQNVFEGHAKDFIRI